MTEPHSLADRLRAAASSVPVPDETPLYQLPKGIRSHCSNVYNPNGERGRAGAHDWSITSCPGPPGEGAIWQAIFAFTMALSIAA